MMITFPVWASPFVERLGWVLVHFLWEGAVMAAVLWGVLMALPRASARVRYAMSIGAMVLLVAAPVGTFGVLGGGEPAAEKAVVVERPTAIPAIVVKGPPAAPVERSGKDMARWAAVPEREVGAAGEAVVAAPAAEAGHGRVAHAAGAAWRWDASWLMPWCVGAWAAGVCMMGVWHLGGWIAVQRLRRMATRPVKGAVRELSERLRERMGIRKPVRLLESALAATPMVIGWIKPAILLPGALATGLSMGQLEVILAHELAHIRRHDYVVNLLQTLAETLLFYHPAVWWVSQQIRQEREHCCDDEAVRLGGNRIAYAEALLQVQMLRQAGPALGMGGGVLLPRIRRLLGQGETRVTQRSLAAVALALVLVAAPLVMKPPEVKAQTRAATQPTEESAVVLAAPEGVVQDLSGKALGGAKVTLFYNAMSQGLDDRVVEQVTTDEKGHFAFTKKLAFKNLASSEGDEYVVFALHPEYALGWETIPANAGSEPLKLVVSDLRMQALQIQDREGHPIAGAKVSVIAAGDRDSTVPSLHKYFQLYSDGVVSGATDAQGEVMLNNLPQTQVWYRVSAPGYAEVTWWDKKNSAAVVTVKLAPAGVVQGVVKDGAGNPVTGARVNFMTQGSAQIERATRTDGKGAYRIELVPKDAMAFPTVQVGGDYQVTIRHPDVAAGTKTITVEDGKTYDLPIEAVPGVLVKGRLLESGTEKPVAGGRVFADTPGGRMYLITDTEGRFTFRAPAAGMVSATFESPPLGLFEQRDPRAPRPSDQIAIGPKTKEISLTVHTGALERQTRVEGRVMMPDGKGIGGLTIEAQAKAGGPGYWASAKSDENGRFVLERVPTGATLHLYTQTKDRAYAVEGRVEVPKEGDLPAAELKLRETETVQVTIVDAEGKALPDTRLNVIPCFDHETPNVPGQVTTDGDGRATIPWVLRGMQYQVRLAHVTPGKDKALEDACVYLPLLPEKGERPTRVVVSNLLPIRVVDGAGKLVPIEDLQTLQIEIEGNMQWSMGPKPEIKGRLADGSVLVEREIVLLAHDGNSTTLTFKTTGGMGARASGPFPENTCRLELKLAAKIENAGLTLGGEGVPGDVAADEIAGRVVDGAGKPVAGATISFPDNIPAEWKIQRPELPGPATTDGAGVFRVPHAPRFAYMQVDAAGYARRWLTVVPRGKAVTIKMDDRTRIHGEVRMPSGDAAAGAELTFVTTRPNERYPDMPISDIQMTVKSNERGHYDTLIEPGEYDVRVKGPEGHFARLEKVMVNEGATTEQPVALAPGVRLRIHVVNTVTGGAASGVKLYVVKHLPFVTLVEPGTERTTDAQGMAEWESVMPGMQLIEPSTTAYARWISPQRAHRDADEQMNNQAIALDLKPGMGEVEVKMEPAMHVKGKVVDEKGAPVKGVYVNVEGFQTGDRRYMQATDAAGAFELWVPAKYYGSGMYHVVVAREPNYGQPDAVGGEFAPTPGGEETITVTLRGGATTQGGAGLP